MLKETETNRKAKENMMLVKVWTNVCILMALVKKGDAGGVVSIGEYYGMKITSFVF